MQFDFSQIHDIDSYVSIPEGSYVCRVAEVREGLARDGSPRWSLRLEVSRGEYAGRTAGWDSLTWSDRGIRRVKHVLESLGIDVRGPVEIVPADLLGREAQAVFQAEEREDPLSGRRVMRLRVPYAGFAPLDGSPSVDSELDAALREAPSASSGGAPSMPRGLAGPWDDASSESPGGGALGNGVARSIADDDED
ncbi:MAG: hypothetical protein IT454_12270 [Planctomycetes bacterium]|nr:hypothetical protein [Planctomycetota bacterium]